MVNYNNPKPTDVDFGGFSLNPVTGQFVIRSPRTGELNGHHIEWKKLDEEEMHVVCTKCEQGIAIEPNSEAVKWLHGYFYSNGCPEDKKQEIGKAESVTINDNGVISLEADVSFK